MKTLRIKRVSKPINIFMIIAPFNSKRDLLFLTDYATGSRKLLPDDRVLYQSPQYDEDRHNQNQYYWLGLEDFYKEDINRIFEQNLFHVHRLSKGHPYDVKSNGLLKKSP